MASKRAKLPVIKPQTGFVRLSDGDLLQRLNAVHDGLLGNPAYPNPPIDLAEFKTVIEAYTSAVAALDGGRVSTVRRDKCREDAIVMLRMLAHYVEAACKNDMSVFVSSGFVAAYNARTTAQPISATRIVSVDQGNTGELLIRINPVPKAGHYELRYGPVLNPANPINWISMLANSTKPPVSITNLTRGTDYRFQVRVYGKLGYSDWSPAVERMCI